MAFHPIPGCHGHRCSLARRSQSRHKTINKNNPQNYAYDKDDNKIPAFLSVVVRIPAVINNHDISS
jgi:hypothetical protein